MEQTKTPPRPKRNDDAIIKAVARRLAPQVLKWLDDETADIDEIAADLEKEIKYHDDGYEIARGLDGTCSPDARLVEILDNCASYRYTAHEAACVEWVEASKIKPVPIGSNVRWPRKKEAGIGVVTANHPDGKSTVTFSALGQKTGGYVIEWEALILEEAK